MQHNWYFRAVYHRKNKVRDFLLDLALELGSYPRLALEVFIRKNFGSRYFTAGSALFVAILLFLFPLMGDVLPSLLISHRYGMRVAHGNDHFWGRYATWYVFVGAYLVFSVRRYLEVDQKPNFDRFSHSEGRMLPFFYEYKPLDLNLSQRQRVIFFEPGVFFIAGLLLKSIGQPLGLLLIVCSIFYGASYRAAFRKGDELVKDKIDEMILNGEMIDAFVNDNPNNKRGVRIWADKPGSRELRQKLADELVEKETVSRVV